MILSFHGPAPATALAIHSAVRADIIARNRQGGVDGRRLELVSLDGTGDSAERQRRLEELTRDPMVVLVLSGVALELPAGVTVISVSSPDEAQRALRSRIWP